MSMSISGGNQPVSSERVAPIQTARISVSTEADGASQHDITREINKVDDLRKAELRGERVTISDEQVVMAIERAIKAMQGKSTSLEFSIHEKTKMIAVKVLNADTGEVIREIPPERTLDFVARLWEMAGLLIDEQR